MGKAVSKTLEAKPRVLPHFNMAAMQREEVFLFKLLPFASEDPPAEEQIICLIIAAGYQDFAEHRLVMYDEETGTGSIVCKIPHPDPTATASEVEIFEVPGGFVRLTTTSFVGPLSPRASTNTDSTGSSPRSNNNNNDDSTASEVRETMRSPSNESSPSRNSRRGKNKHRNRTNRG